MEVMWHCRVYVHMYMYDDCTRSELAYSFCACTKHNNYDK